MNASEHHVAHQPPIWSRVAHCFRRFNGERVVHDTRVEEHVTESYADADWGAARPAFEPPVRVTVPEPRRATASIEAWRTSPAVMREKRRSFLAGFIAAMVLYGVGSALLISAFICLGFRP